MIPIPGINSLIEGVGNIISKFKHSPAEKAEAMLELGKLHHTMVQEALKFEIAQVQAQASIILAEAKSGWLTRNWRPMLMLTFMAIIVNTFLIWPYSVPGVDARPVEEWCGWVYWGAVSREDYPRDRGGLERFEIRVVI